MFASDVRSTFMSSLDRCDAQLLADRSSERRYSQGQILFREGESARAVYIVLDGDLKVTKSSVDGRQIVLSLPGRGELVGETAIARSMNNATTAEAIGATVTVLVTPAQTFENLLMMRPNVSLAFARSLAAQIDDASERALERSTTDCLGRLCARLLELNERFGMRTADGWEFDSPLSQTELAEWIGVSRDGVVRALTTARRLGWLHTRRQGYVLLRVDELAKRAGLGHVMAAA